MPGSFIDTTVLVYLASGDAAKADRTEAILAAGGTISIQVLSELSHIARRKMRLSWEELQGLLQLVRGLLRVEPLTVETHETGLALAERYGLSLYDAMIAASVLLAGCERLWSEDLQDGLTIDRRLHIANPFHADQI